MSIVNSQKSYYMFEYSINLKIVLYARVQYIPKNPHCTSECNVFLQIYIVRPSAIYHVHVMHYTTEYNVSVKSA